MPRTELSHGHSHALLLPETPPAERSVFWTEPDGEDFHTHAFFWGGPGENFGQLQTESAGFDEALGEGAKRGSLNPLGPDEDPTFPHSHNVAVLR